MIRKLGDFVTLLDLAKIFKNKAFKNLTVSYSLLEEKKIIPHLKPRQYFISSDPFADEKTATGTLKFLFEETFVRDNQLGLCSQFLTSPETFDNSEIKI